jgi:heterodisulfide reductase subunit A-like polyferredoxin
VPIHRNVRDIAIEGDTRAEAIRFTAGGRAHRLPCDTVGLHEGVIPQQQMTRALGLDHDFDAGQRCFRPRHDASGRTSKAGVFVAGDAGGIIGAEASAQDGTIAALAALHDLGRLTAEKRDRRISEAERARRAHLTARPFLDRLYQPRAAILDPPDAVTVCRCEMITAAALRDVTRKGVVGPNQAKAFLRCGMGPCQGRLCGPTVTQVIAHATGLDAAETGYYHIRSPLKPITVGELATATGATDPKR